MNGPPAQGQPEVIDALRDAVAARPGSGIAADPTGANYFAMPQPNTAYGTAFDGLVNAMVARGPQEKAADAEKAATPSADPAAKALADIQAAGNRAYNARMTGGDVRGQGMSDVTWRAAMDKALADADLSGLTEEQRASFEKQYRERKPPTAPAYISDRGGVR